MNKKVKVFVTWAFVICLTCIALSCAKRGKAVDNVKSVANYHVELIFEVEGAKVYRFSDGGSYRYLAVAPNSLTVESRIKQGKSSRPESIQTVWP